MDDVKLPLPAQPSKFIDQLRTFIRTDGKAYATEQTYVQWIRSFIFFHQKKHPREMGTKEVEAYLTHLAVQRNASVNTQKTVLNSLVYLYSRFLNQPLDELDFRHAKKPTRVPTVFSHEQAIAVINQLKKPYKDIANLMYGSGLRISEAIRLRVKDIDFQMGYILVRNGKGAKDRTTLLPKSCILVLQKQIVIVDKLLSLDFENGVGPVYMPHILQTKYPKAGRSLAWQFIFPSVKTSIDPRSQVERRHHINKASVQHHVKLAIRSANIHKQAGCHTFRHSFATRLLQQKYDLRQIQTLMGHSDIRTTEVYLHVLEDLGDTIKSPID